MAKQHENRGMWVVVAKNGYKPFIMTNAHDAADMLEAGNDVFECKRVTKIEAYYEASERNGA